MKNFQPRSNETKNVLIAQDRLQERVSELGAEISQAYADKDLVLIAILKGSFVFAADLIRAMSISAHIEFMAISSYAAEQGSGVVRITKDIDASVTGRHVLMVEDIIDTGLTANYLLRLLRQRSPASLATCALLDKSARRLIDLPIAYRGFEIPDVFVIGYGMDFQQRYRNLPYVATMGEKQ